MAQTASIWRFRWLIVIAILVVFVILAGGVSGLSLNANYNAYFDPADPFLDVQVNMAEQYAQFDGVVVILESLRDDMLKPSHYAAIERISSAAMELPFAVSVYSISNPIFVASDDRLPRLDEELSPYPDAATIPRRERLLAHERVRGLLLSDDARLAVVNISFDLPSDQGAEELLDVLGRLRALVQREIDDKALPIEAHYTGTLALNEAYIQVVRHDLKLFLPSLLVLFLLCLYLLFRSLRVAVYILLSATLAVVGAFSIAGWLRFELASIHAFVPVIIASISIASSVHITSSYLRYRSSGQSAADGIANSLSFNLLPLSLTSLTTALGFLGLAFSPSPPVRVVGYVVAFGIGLSYTLTLTLLPALLFGIKPKGSLELCRDFRIPAVIRFVDRHSKAVLIVFSVGAILSLYGVRGNEINDNVFEYFPESHDFRHDTELAEQKFSGVNQILYSIETGKVYGIFASELFDRLDAFATWLRKQPETRRVLVLTDIPEFRNRLAGNNSDESISQYLLLAQHNTPASFSLQQEISADFSATRVMLYLKNLDARILIAFDQRVRIWLERHLSPFTYQGGAGTSLTFAHLGQRNAKSMVYSLGIALAAIAVIAGFILRSANAAWIGLICNIFPVIMVYSVWALADGHISIGGAIVIGMILGIVVDDTIYLLAKYASARRRGDADPMARSLRQVGPALIITTITLCVGLSVGLLSDFGPILTMSALSVAIILIALIADLLVLPSLLRHVNKPRPGHAASTGA